MREIKFRAWEEELKIMDYGKELKGGIEYECSPVRAINIILNEDDHGFVYMQYTGLKDKNGKEIYEGDIIKSFNQVGYVKFELGGYYIEWIKEKYDSYVTDIRNNGEVIGNIYENPELMEVAG